MIRSRLKRFGDIYWGLQVLILAVAVPVFASRGEWVLAVITAALLPVAWWVWRRG